MPGGINRLHRRNRNTVGLPRRWTRLLCDGSIVGWHPEGRVQKDESKTQGPPGSGPPPEFDAIDGAATRCVCAQEDVGDAGVRANAPPRLALKSGAWRRH